MASEIGKLFERYSEVQWTISDIFSYIVRIGDECFHSPPFYLFDCEWCLVIYPNGQTRNNKAGWISLYLYTTDECAKPKSLNFTFGIKKANSEIEVKDDLLWVFDEAGRACGISNFLHRLELLRRSFELAPSGSLTITCTLRMDDSLGCNERLHVMSDNLLDLFSDKSSDMTVKIGHEEFAVHKFILGARSPVFAAMFEADTENSSIINIEGCHPESFRDFLLYLYTGELKSVPNNVFELYRIGHKCVVVELKKACLNFIMKNLSLENVCDAAILAHMFKEPCLKLKIQNFFNENFKQIIHTNEWKYLLKGNYDVANALLQHMAPKIKLEYDFLSMTNSFS